VGGSGVAVGAQAVSKTIIANAETIKAFTVLIRVSSRRETCPPAQ
jgi:hypothetical protein